MSLLTFLFSIWLLWALVAKGSSPTPLPLQLHLLSTQDFPRAVCNDGSPGAFYLREGGAATWVIHLQDGFWCWDEASCLQRKQNSEHFTSSKSWTDNSLNGESWCQHGGECGIFSPDASVNPGFNSATKVFIAYCSSDAHSGNTPDTVSLGAEKWYFRGKEIVRATIMTLKKQHALHLTNESRILISGGMGAVANVDFIRDLLLEGIVDNSTDWSLTVRGAIDAGFYVDVAPLSACALTVTSNLSAAPTPHPDCLAVPACVGSMPLAQQMQRASSLWSAEPDASCDAYMGRFMRWKCFFGPSMEHISSRLFVVQMQADAWQLGWNGVPLLSGTTVTHDQMPEYAAWFRNQTVEALVDSVLMVRHHTLFAPQCHGGLQQAHSMLDSSLFWNISIAVGSSSGSQNAATTLNDWLWDRHTLPSHRLLESLSSHHSIGCV